MGRGRVYTGLREGHYCIAVDFDGTLVHDAFPEIGKIRNVIVACLRHRVEELKLDGFCHVHLILWTCREGDYLEEAKLWCAHNLPEIEYFNENPVFEHYTGVTTRKIYADEYWDDRAVKV